MNTNLPTSITLRLDSDLLQRLKEKANRMNVSVSELFREEIRRYNDGEREIEVPDEKKKLAKTSLLADPVELTHFKKKVERLGVPTEAALRQVMESIDKEPE